MADVCRAGSHETDTERGKECQDHLLGHKGLHQTFCILEILGINKDSIKKLHLILVSLTGMFSSLQRIDLHAVWETAPF